MAEKIGFGKKDITAKQKKNSDARSAVPFLWGRCVRKIYRLSSSGCIGKYLSSYDITERKAEKAFFAAKPVQIRNRIIDEKRKKKEIAELPDEANNVVIYKESSINKSFTHRVSSSWHSSAIISFLTSIKDGFLNTQAASYGVLIFAFSLSVIVMQSLALVSSSIDMNLVFPSEYIQSGLSGILISCIYAVLFILLSIPLMFTGGSLIELLFKSRITGSFLRGVMGYRDTELLRRSAPIPRNFRCFVIGWVLGSLTLFVSPLKMIALFVVAIGVIITYILPEVGIVISLFLLPMVSFLENSLEISFYICAFIDFSALIKIFRGERIVKFKLIDWSVLAFLLVVLFGGVISVGGVDSLRDAAAYFVIGLTYFVVASLMKSWHWIKRALGAVTVSGFIVAIMALVSYIIHFVQGNGSVMASDISISSVFETRTVLAIYMVICIFSTVAYITGKRCKPYSLGGITVILVCLTVLVLTTSFVSLFALLVSFVIYSLIRTQKSVPVILVFIFTGFMLWGFLPVDIRETVVGIFNLSDQSVLERLRIWKIVSQAVTDNIIGGIGVGESAFALIYPLYSPSGTLAVTNACNLYLQIMLEVGIGGILTFAIMILLTLRICFTLFRRYGKEIEASEKALALTCGIVALLIIGVAEHIWSNPCIYMMFFMFVGLVVAIYRRQMLEKISTEEEYRFDIEYPIKEKRITLRKRAGKNDKEGGRIR